MQPSKRLSNERHEGAYMASPETRRLNARQYTVSPPTRTAATVRAPARLSQAAARHLL